MDSLEGVNNERCRDQSPDRRSDEAELRLLVNVRKEVRRAEVEEKAGEERELECEHRRGDVDDVRDERPRNRRKCVDRQQQPRPPCAVAAREHERDRVQPIGEIVREHCEQYDDADIRPGLKADADREAVQKTME